MCAVRSAKWSGEWMSKTLSGFVIPISVGEASRTLAALAVTLGFEAAQAGTASRTGPGPPQPETLSPRIEAAPWMRFSGWTSPQPRKTRAVVSSNRSLIWASTARHARGRAQRKFSPPPRVR